LKIWLNGNVLTPEAAAIPVTDRGLLFGDALFETFRAYRGVVFRLRDHLARLADSCRFFNLELPLTLEEVRRAVTALLAANQMTDAAVRLTLTRGPVNAPLGLPASDRSNLFMTLRRPGYPPELYDRGLRLITASVRRNDFSPLSRHKTTNYLDALLARREAAQAGADEALMLDNTGAVTECATANVFAVRDDAVLTPALDAPILPGVTRAVVLELCDALSLPVSDRRISPEDLRNVDEVFVTNSVIELAPVTSLDGRPVGTGKPGPLYQRLAQAYRDCVDAECGT